MESEPVLYTVYSKEGTWVPSLNTGALASMYSNKKRSRLKQVVELAAAQHLLKPLLWRINRLYLRTLESPEMNTGAINVSLITVRPPTGLFYRKRPPQRNGDRRKGHCTKCTGLRPCWRSLRQMRVPGHAGRSDVIMVPPPPPIVHTNRPKSVIFKKSV